MLIRGSLEELVDFFFLFELGVGVGEKVDQTCRFHTILPGNISSS